MIEMTKILGQNLSPKFETDYIGTVEDNEDPNKQGRLKVRIPELYGSIPKDHLPWATTSSPFGGGSNYGFFMVPPKGAKVKIHLWRNHPWFPEWYGTHWFKGEVPSEAQLSPPLNYVFKTPEGHTLEFSDVEGKKYIKFTDVNGNHIEFDSEKNDRNEDVGNDWNITVGGKVTIMSADKIVLDGGTGNVAGLVNGLGICHFTGGPHGDVSSEVLCSKG